jgi:hypothetical protein
MILRFVIPTIVFLCTMDVAAQRAIPIGALPGHYNGGFAGEAGSARLASYAFLNHSNNSYFLNSTSSGYAVSFDTFLKKISSGVGFSVGMENESKTRSGTLVSIAFAPKISFKGKYTFSPFIDLSYDRSQFNFPDDYVAGFPSEFVTHDFKIRSGFLLNSTRSYIGLTAYVADYATELSLVDGQLMMDEKWRTFSDMSYTLQAGYTFQQTPVSKFSFTPQLAISYSHHLKYDYAISGPVRANAIALLDLNLMFRYTEFLIGINSTGLALGYQTDRLKLVFTNFYSINGSEGKELNLGNHTYFTTKPVNEWSAPKTYTGNISLRYIFKSKESPKMSGF